MLRSAIALADEGGIDALSMRKLAKELGVEAMSLYNHVANKGDLVEGMVDAVVNEIDLPSTPDWEQDVRTCAISAYETFLRHSWACYLVMAPAPPDGRIRLEGNPRLQYMEWLLGRLRDAGFSDELTYRGYHALDSHILGFTMWHVGHSAGSQGLTDEGKAFLATIVPRLQAAGLPHLAEHAEHHLDTPWTNAVSEFEFGLDLILDGLKKAL